MKYLFFDIECSDGHNICSFGYVVINDNFEIIEKDDIVINPESKFILSPSKKRPKIELAYTKEYFYSQGNFETKYEKIKSILFKENQLIFGHSISSDFHFLINACKRYNLEKFDLIGYDTQKMYQIALNKVHVESLEKIITELNIKKQIQFHKSSEDAHATFLVAKELCKMYNINLKQLTEKFYSCQVDSKNFVAKQTRERFIDKVEKLKKQYENTKYLATIAFSEIFKIFKKEEQINIVEEIYKKGYNFTTKINECDIFVKNNIDLERDNYCKALIANGKNIKRVSLNQFLKMIDYKVCSKMEKLNNKLNNSKFKNKNVV